MLLYWNTLITLGILSIYRRRKEGGGDKWTVMVARARRCFMQYYANDECYDDCCDYCLIILLANVVMNKTNGGVYVGIFKELYHLATFDVKTNLQH